MMNRVWVGVCLAGISVVSWAGADLAALRAEFQEVERAARESTHLYVGFDQIPPLEAAIGDMSQSLDERVGAAMQLAWEYIRVGEVAKAVALIEGTFQQAADTPGHPELDPQWHRLRGLAYLRQAELDNCIVNHNRDCCVFPLQGGGVHQLGEPAAESRRSFLAYLERVPDDDAVKWTLNILSMALGDFPQGVDPAYRVDPARLQSEHDIGRFENIAPLLGVDVIDLSGGAIVDDFTGNGFHDIVTSSVDPRERVNFFRNLGNGRFENASESSGLGAQQGGLNITRADFDNDGHLDIFVPRGAWFRNGGLWRNSLLRNRGDGTFEDVTRAAGMGGPKYPTQTAVWFDYDNDGLLDLFVGNEDFSDTDPAQRFPCQLFRNNGDGTFTDVAAAAGVTVHRYVKGAAAGDFDNDGHPDLYVSVLFGPNYLFRNNGDGTFSDVTATAGVSEPSGFSYLPGGGLGADIPKKGASFPCAFLDFNNDGHLDIFVADFSASHTDLLRQFRNEPHDGIVPSLYRNNGDGTFTDVAAEMGISGTYRVMGMGFGDLDNDGWLDIFLTTGTPDYLALMPNVMMRNDAGRRFQDVTVSGGFGNLQKGHGVCFADINNNGFQDVYHQQGGAYPGDRYQNALYLNPGHEGGFLYLNLEGRKSNRFGVGARVKVTVETDAGRREIHRVAGLGSSFGNNPMRVEIGIGAAKAIPEVEVWWPASGIRTTYRDVAPNASYRVVEGDDELVAQPMRTFSFKPILAGLDKPGL